MKVREFVEYINSLGYIVDRRQRGKVKHSFGVIVVLYALAKMAGYNNCVEAEDFCRSNLEVLKRHIGIDVVPSHDTFSRVLKTVDSSTLAKLIAKFEVDVARGRKSMGLLRSMIAIDGKTMRGTGLSDDAYEPQRQAHIVSALDHVNGIVMGQVCTDEKSNEITAIPRLLNNLGDISGSVVTIDAMGTQFKIAQQIINSGADYCLALKGNQAGLQEDADLYISTEDCDDQFSTEDVRHKSIVKRIYRVYKDAEWMDRGRKVSERFHMKALATAETLIDGVTSERRTFIMSDNFSAEEVSRIVRGHWSIESMHWSLDVSFDEDRSYIKDHNAAAVDSLINKLALFILNEMPNEVLGLKPSKTKASVNRKRKAFLATLDRVLPWVLDHE